MAKKLFNKPMDELRKAFVRTKFAQGDMFGFAEIEAWLRAQRTAELPDSLFGSRSFVGLIGRHVLMTPGEVHDFLMLRATSHAGRPDDGEMPNAQLRIAFDGILEIPDVKVWYGANVIMLRIRGGAVHVLRPHRNFAQPYLGEISPIGTLEPRDLTTSLLDVCVMEWVRHGEQWKRAREYLCTTLGRIIIQQRRKAQADFDTAVAVSEDGTKIVHADYVVVVEICGGRLCTRIYPATAFSSRKLIRASEMPRHRILVAPREHTSRDDVVAITDALALTLGDWPETQWRRDIASNPKISFQELRDYLGEGRGTNRFVLTTRDFCPTPLPDGGVEVTV